MTASLEPLDVFEAVRSGALEQHRLDRLARVSNAVLLAPVVLAFLELLVRRRVPSLVWPFSLLVAAVATRLLKRLGGTGERPAVLGIDGVLLWSGFVPASSIAHVALDAGVVVVTGRDEERIELRVRDDDLAEAQALVNALKRAADATSPDAAGARALLEWRGSEATLAAGGAYRRLGLDEERCVAIVEDACAPIEARIAAAELVAPHADPALRARLAVVERTTAHPALRHALRAAEGP